MKNFVDKIINNYHNSKGLEKGLWLLVSLAFTLIVLPLMFVVIPSILGILIGIIGSI